MTSSANEIYRFTHRGLCDLVSARVATRVLDGGLDRARLAPETVDLEGMTKILLGPVLRDLQTILPRDGLKHNLREIVRALRKIERRQGREAARQAAKKAGKVNETFIDALPVGASSNLDLAAAFPLSAGDLSGAGGVDETHADPSAAAGAPVTGEAVVEPPTPQDPVPSDPASPEAIVAVDEAVGLDDAVFDDAPDDDAPNEYAPDEYAPDGTAPDGDDPDGAALTDDVVFDDALLEDAITDEPAPERAGEPAGDIEGGVEGASPVATGEDVPGGIEGNVEHDGAAVEGSTAVRHPGALESASAVSSGDPPPPPEPDPAPEPAVMSSSATAVAGAVAAVEATAVDEGPRVVPGGPVAVAAERAPIAGADSVDEADADSPIEVLERAVMAFAQLEHVQLVAAVRWSGQIAISRGAGPDLDALSRLGLSGLRLLGRSGTLRSYYLSHSHGQLFLFPLGRDTIIVVGSTELNLGGVFAALTALKEEL